MAKNILIFADGTGNESGLLPDESRTNVYKLFRATRIGPDSNIDPRRQVAFYIPGVGTPGARPPNVFKRMWKGIQQAVGGGLTAQIADCYAAIISVWQPGDRIYLIGFSRGAYAARCVAHILEVLGIPTTDARGNSISLEPRSLRSIARSGAKVLYRLGLPQPNQTARDANAGKFIAQHSCRVGAAEGALPYAICIWDAVGAVGWLHFTVAKLVRRLPFVSDHHDMHFPSEVKFARHAMAIDEYRRDFLRVPWGGTKTVPQGDHGGVTRFRQTWFAGNHADIGGSYPENESRLSDISLKWMANFISKELPGDEAKIQIDESVLRCYPSADGMMHDELMVGHTRANIHIWTNAERKVDPSGELHPTVIERFGLLSVRNYVGYGPYRPRSLSDHPKVRQFYGAAGEPHSGIVSTASGASE
jgi:hypothetical protein